jgi:hypothetical protein
MKKLAKRKATFVHTLSATSYTTTNQRTQGGSFEGPFLAASSHYQRKMFSATHPSQLDEICLHIF